MERFRYMYKERLKNHLMRAHKICLLKRFIHIVPLYFLQAVWDCLHRQNYIYGTTYNSYEINKPTLFKIAKSFIFHFNLLKSQSYHSSLNSQYFKTLEQCPIFQII